MSASRADGAGDLALVILAAGASRRLGTCKALVSLGGRTALERLLAAGTALGSGPPPLVVTGAHRAELHASLVAMGTAPAVELVHNPAWDRGRTGSVLLASRLRPGSALCLAPVDVPRVPAEVFAALAAGWRRAGAPPRGWLAPRADGGRGRYGHPVLAGPELLAEALGGAGAVGPDTPLRALRDRATPLLSVPVSGKEVLEDLDTGSDLARIRSRLPETDP